MCARERSLQRRDAIRVRCIRIRSMREQDIDRFGVAPQRRQHQGRTAMGIAGIHVDRSCKQCLQTREVTCLGRLLQCCGGINSAGRRCHARPRSHWRRG